MAVKGLEMTWAESFRYLALKPSNLVVLSVLRLWSCFKMKVLVTNGIENSGAFSKFTLTHSLILFTSVVLTLVIDIIFCTEFFMY